MKVLSEKTSMVTFEKLREDFPVLKRHVNDEPLVYFDNAATSQKPSKVIEAVEEYYRNYNANVHRGIHKLAEEATLAFEQAREKVANFVGATKPLEIIFVRNATEAINLVAYTWGRQNIRKGDRIILSIMEHHSNIVPWQLLARERGATVEYVSIDNEGRLKLDQLKELIDSNTKIISIAHASNVLGTVNPIKDIAKIAHKYGALFLADSAQSVPHMPVDVKESECDFMTFSGHKMMGPTGIGVLYGKREHLDTMPPFLTGGEMIREVHTTGASWNELPYKFEAGTPDIAGAIGLGAAVDYLSKMGMDNVYDHEKMITSYALSRMTDMKDLTIYGPKDSDRRTGVISFNLGDIHAHDLASILDEQGVAIRSGHHCAQPLMEFLGIPAASRASFYVYNTKHEVDIFIGALEKAKRLFN